MFATKDVILWEEGDNGGHLLNEEESGGYSEFAFILIKCVNGIVLVIVLEYFSSVMFI
jgi:hypothetical protein